MNNEIAAKKLPSPMTAEHRNALLTVLRYELRDGWTIEEAATRHSVSIEFAKKAMKPRKQRSLKGTSKSAKLKNNDDSRALIADLTDRLATLEKTVYELIDLVWTAKGTT